MGMKQKWERQDSSYVCGNANLLRVGGTDLSPVLNTPKAQNN